LETVLRKLRTLSSQVRIVATKKYTVRTFRSNLPGIASVRMAAIHIEIPGGSLAFHLLFRCSNNALKRINPWLGSQQCACHELLAPSLMSQVFYYQIQSQYQTYMLTSVFAQDCFLAGKKTILESRKRSCNCKMSFSKSIFTKLSSGQFQAVTLIKL